MQLQICCVMLSVVSVLARCRHQWPNSYGPSAPYYISHKIPANEELRSGWMDFYEYRPFFSRVIFGIPDSTWIWKPAGENRIKGRGDTPPSTDPGVGAPGFLDWRQEFFGPPKQMELQQGFPTGNSDSQELINGDQDLAQNDDSTRIKDDADEGVDDSEEKEEHDHSTEEHPDKNGLLDDGGKSEYPASSPELVEPIPDKTSDEVPEDITELEESVDPLDLSEPADVPWNPWKSAFDFPSYEERPSDFFHSNGQSSEVHDPVKFASQNPFYKFWNSAEEFSFFSDDDNPGLPESPESVADPEPSISPVPSTTPEPIYKFSGQSVADGPKTVYKHNYRKVPIDKNKRLQAQID